MRIAKLLVLLPCLTFACSTGKPCAEGGDLSGLPLIRGDRECFQKQLPDGRYANDGRFLQRYPNGSVAIEGDFKEGRREGVWIFYNEKGNKIAEKYYVHGVEMGARPQTVDDSAPSRR